MPEELRSCVTCTHLHEACDGDCDKCKQCIEDRVGSSRCRCFRCGPNNGYKYYEEDPEKARFFE